MPPKKSQAASQLSELPLPLPAFLKMLASSGLSMADSMSIASKIFKEYNTPAKLAQLTVVKLTDLKVEDKEQRNKILAALRKAGYKEAEKPSPVPAEASSSKATPSPRKRRRDDDMNEALSPAPRPKGAEYASLDFGEILDEDALITRSCVTNRAPIMTAWATVVAERLGFKREEALSIASVYTEMNATSKGIALGIFDKGKQSESAVGSAQPFVTLLGRNPVMRIENEEWRGVIRGAAVEPATAFGYVHRSLRQMTPFVLGALRLLSLSFEPYVLNDKGFGLYAEFRPKAEAWGKREEMRLADVLALRRVGTATGAGLSRGVQHTEKAVVEEGPVGDAAEDGRHTEDGEPDRKRRRGMTLEEYEEALDEEEMIDPAELEALEAAVQYDTVATSY